MRLSLLLLLCSTLQAGITVFSDIAVSQQGVGYRASISVAKYCIPGDPRDPCVTGSKATLFRDQSGVQGLSNPFQSLDNGRFTFFVEAGWYDILVSGLGISTYSYRVYLTDGTFDLTGGAGGDLCGSYPAPTVCGIRGYGLPAANLLSDGKVPAFKQSTNNWEWRTPIWTLPALGGDVTGTLPAMVVGGIHNRPIYNAVAPQNNWTILWDQSNTRWKYGAVPSTATKVAMTFSVCLGVECQVAANVANPFIVTTDTMSLERCYIAARIPPTSQNLVVDILKNGGSIFPGGPISKMNLTPSGGVEVKLGLTTTAVAADVFTVSIVQVGSGFGGQDVTVSCLATVQ